MKTARQYDRSPRRIQKEFGRVLMVFNFNRVIYVTWEIGNADKLQRSAGSEGDSPVQGEGI